MSPGPRFATHAHVLRLEPGPRYTWRIEYATLPVQHRGAIQDAIGYLGPSAFLACEVEAARVSCGLPGLVLLCAKREQVPALPAPLDYPFEPVPLRAGAADEHLNSLMVQRGVSGSAPAASPPLRRMRRRWASVLIATVGFALAVGRPPGTPTQVLACIVVAAQIGYWTWKAFLGFTWQLVPQGVFLQQRCPPWSAAVLPAADCTLVLEPAAGAFRLWLARRGRSYQHQLSATECTALLAAWQSPVPPPSVEDVLNLA
jgi:hypothetical protein